MSAAQFERLVEELRSLDLEEQERVYRLLDTWLTPRPQHQSPEAEAEDRFEQALLEEGILSALPRRRIPDGQKRSTPKENSGRLLSEILLEERR